MMTTVIGDVVFDGKLWLQASLPDGKAVIDDVNRKSCGKCKHLAKATESWELPDIWWWECNARPGLANLKSFPFRDTKCKSYEAKDPS